MQRLAETLNEMLARLESALQRERDFVADAGHELRTPLALLRTELELALRHAETPEELREAVRVSSEEVERLTRLSEDLLLIAGSDHGQMPLRLESLDRRSCSRRSRDVSSGGRRRRGDRSKPQRSRGCGWRVTASGSSRRLGNLVDNATRYAHSTIGLRLYAEDGQAVIEVADDGAGVPPAEADRIFERFVRLDESRERATGGTGLGLSIVREIARRHGGDVVLSGSDGSAPSGRGGAAGCLVGGSVRRTAADELRSVGLG